MRKGTEVFFDEIGAALAARGSLPDDFKRDPEYKECRYVVRMCQKIAGLIGDVSVKDVLRVERCAAGHVDYQRKFALYCLELAEKQKQRRRVYEYHGC